MVAEPGTSLLILKPMEKIMKNELIYEGYRVYT